MCLFFWDLKGEKKDTWDFNWSWKPRLLGLREEESGVRRRWPSVGTPVSWERKNSLWAGMKSLYLSFACGWGGPMTYDLGGV